MSRQYDKAVYIKGVALVVDEPTVTGRIYSWEMMADAVSKFREERLNTPGNIITAISVEVEHVDLDNVSHVVTDVKLLGSEVWASCRILNTPMGKMLKEAFDIHLLRPTPVMVGTVNENKVVTDVEILYFNVGPENLL